MGVRTPREAAGTQGQEGPPGGPGRAFQAEGTEGHVGAREGELPAGAVDAKLVESSCQEWLQLRGPWAPPGQRLWLGAQGSGEK